jgi:glycosyltransferase involved in cell wall biosynthesis
MRDANPRVLIAIPAYREEKTIGRIVAALRQEYPYDVLVVSDGSPDGTATAAREAGALVLDLPCNLGIGGAVQTAFRFAHEKGYDAVVRRSRRAGKRKIREDQLLRRERKADHLLHFRFRAGKSARTGYPPGGANLSTCTDL